MIELILLMQYRYRSKCKFSIEEPQKEPYSHRVITDNREENILMSIFLVDFELDRDRETDFVSYLLVFLKWP